MLAAEAMQKNSQIGSVETQHHTVFTTSNDDIPTAGYGRHSLCVGRFMEPQPVLDGVGTDHGDRSAEAAYNQSPRTTWSQACKMVLGGGRDFPYHGPRFDIP